MTHSYQDLLDQSCAQLLERLVYLQSMLRDRLLVSLLWGVDDVDAGERLLYRIGQILLLYQGPSESRPEETSP